MSAYMLYILSSSSTPLFNWHEKVFLETVIEGIQLYECEQSMYVLTVVYREG